MAKKDVYQKFPKKGEIQKNVSVIRTLQYEVYGGVESGWI